MIKDLHIIQKELDESIKIIIPAHPIDIGKYTTRTLKYILLESKDEIEIDFDDVRTYPGQQPRESMDIELLKNKMVVAKLNVKTSVSGILESTLRKLIVSTRRGCIGTLVLFALFYEDEDKAIPKLIIIMVPEDVLRFYRQIMIEDAIRTKLEQKIKKENYSKYEILAFHDAIEIERLRGSIEAKEMAEEAKKSAMEAKKMAEEAKEIVIKTREEFRKEIRETKKDIEEIKENIKDINSKLEYLIKEMKKR